MTVELGILLALFCALATNFGFLWKHKGACAAPAVEWRHPVRSAVALYSSKWFALGMLVATGAWGFHVGVVALMNIWFPYPLFGFAYLPFFEVERAWPRVRRLFKR